MKNQFSHLKTQLFDFLKLIVLPQFLRKYPKIFPFYRIPILSRTNQQLKEKLAQASRASFQITFGF